MITHAETSAFKISAVKHFTSIVPGYESELSRVSVVDFFTIMINLSFF